MRRLLAVACSAVLVATIAPAHARAAAPDSDDEVVRRVHAVIVATDLVARSCSGVVRGAPEPGETTFTFTYQVNAPQRAASGAYTGKLTFSLGETVIRMPKSIAWANMTMADRERAEAFRHAIYHHEVGHVRVAEAVRDLLNAQAAISASDLYAFGAAADEAGRAGFDRFKHEQRAYDDLTDHGRRQHRASGPLAGPNTVIYCY